MNVPSATKLPTELARLFREARNGSEDAARRIITRYSAAIRRTVRHSLHQKLRAKFDTCDFEQEVWASFFGGRSELNQFDSSSELMKYLVRVARNKVVAEFRRRLQSQKYNVNRERSLDGPDAGPLGIDHSQPTPSQNAIADEEWRRLLGKEPEHYQRMLHMRRDGSTFDEISAGECVNERTARRVVKRARRKWDQPRNAIHDGSAENNRP